MKTRNYGKQYLRVWDKRTVLLPFSEVAMHMQVAGERMEAQLIKTPSQVMVQLWKDGRLFSAPITYGEAGFFKDDCGFYTFEPS